MALKPAVGFGYKTGWLAFRAETQDQVLQNLPLSRVRPADWRAAVEASYARTGSVVAVTPPIQGVGGDWVLVTGTPLLLHAPDTAALSTSTRTEVQYFVSERITETHGWTRSVGGTLLRAFQWSGERGEIMTWVGRPGAAELALGLPDVARPNQTDSDSVFDLDIDEDAVMTIAGKWSVDPSALDELAVAGEPVLGELR